MADNQNNLYRNYLANQMIERFSKEFFDKIGLYPNIRYTPASMLAMDYLGSVINAEIPAKLLARYGNISQNSKKREIVNHKIIFVQIAVSMRYTLQDIGKYLNLANHTSIIHLRDRFDDYYTHDAAVNTLYKTINNKLHGTSFFQPMPIKQNNAKSVHGFALPAKRHKIAA